MALAALSSFSRAHGVTSAPGQGGGSHPSGTGSVRAALACHLLVEPANVGVVHQLRKRSTRTSHLFVGVDHRLVPRDPALLAEPLVPESESEMDAGGNRSVDRH